MRFYYCPATGIYSKDHCFTSMVETRKEDIPVVALKYMLRGYVVYDGEECEIVSVDTEDVYAPVCIAIRSENRTFWPTEPVIQYRNDNLWDGWL